MVLPVEGVATYVPCTALIALRVLQLVVALTIVTTTRDSFVDEIPSLHLSFAGFHHALDPLVHGIDEGIVALLLCLGNSNARRISLELDFFDIDVAYEVATLEHEETALNCCRIGHFHILPFCGERNIWIFSIAPVAQFSMQFSIIRAFYCHCHLVGLAYFGGNIRHGQELNVPGVGVLLGAMDNKTVVGIITK